MYAVATTVEPFGEQYLTKDGWFSMNLFMAILYEYMGEIPPMDNDEEYIIKVEYDKNGKLYKV